MSTFALDASSSSQDIVDGLNYVLANLGDASATSGNGNVFAGYGNVVTANATTGELSTIDSGVVGYLNAYVNIKYANTSTGGSGFSSNSSNRSYYGVDNTTTGNISSNPTDYVWFQVSGGFGTTKSLWYSTIGGGQIKFFAGNATSLPSINYRSVADDEAIALITLANSVVVSNSVATSAITTTKMQLESATQVITQQDSTAYPQLNFVNGNATIGSPDYKWPIFTRGIPVSAPIIPVTDGSVSGSAITVNWNTYLYSATNPTYNCIELYRSGGSAYYQNVFKHVTAVTLGNTAADATDQLLIAGTSGALYVGNVGNITQRISNTNADLYDGFIQPGIVSTEFYNVFGASGAYLYQSATYGLQLSNIGNAVTYYGGTGSAYPLFDMYSVAPIQYYRGTPTSAAIWQPTVIVGSDGTIGFWTGQATMYANGLFAFENSQTLADLFDVAPDWYLNPDILSAGDIINYVAVGASGTILYNSRTYTPGDPPGGGRIATTTGWDIAASGTVNNLNGVSSNPTVQIYTAPTLDTGTRGNTWVVVGDTGTILRSPTGAGSGPWLAATSVPTTQNLNAVAWANGYWMAVGNGGTVLYSTDTDTWTAISIPAVGTRNLYGVGGGQSTGRFVIAGEEIILTADTSNVATTTWANTFIGGASLTTELTRLQFYGSWANIANVSEPPVQQRVTNGQIVSGTYTDTDYVSGSSIAYYLVAGNMAGNAEIYTNGSSITVTEIKR